MIKVKVSDGSVIEFDEKKLYFKRVRTIDSEFYTELAYSFFIGEIKENAEKIYGEKEEYLIDEAVVHAIKKDYPQIKIFEETQVFG